MSIERKTTMASKKQVEVLPNKFYTVSSDGRVWSSKGNLLAQATNHLTGYKFVTAWDKTIRSPRVILVHRLVAKAFVPNPNNLE